MPIRAVLFDFDGTLADTLPLAFVAFRSMFLAFNGRHYTDEEIVQTFGQTEEGIIRNHVHDPEQADAAIEHFYEVFERHFDEMTVPSEDIREMLVELSRGHVRMAIITGKGRRGLDICLKRFGLADVFETTITGDDVTRPKPDPEGIRKALLRLQAEPNEAIFIGDSDADMIAGKAAGMRTVCAQWFETVQSRQFSVEPDLICRSAKDLASWLKRCYRGRTLDISSEQAYLLRSVKDWFLQDDQVSHYANESGYGPTDAEKVLLNSLSNGQTVLDVGCGAGRISVFLAERGYRVTGIDISNRLLSEAKDYARNRQVYVDFVVGNGLVLPFEDGSFDCAVGFKVLCYIPSCPLRSDFLKELYRVLKPGGICVLSQQVVPEKYIHDAKDEYFYQSPASSFRVIETGDTFPLGKGYVHWFTENDLLEELGQSLFEIEWFDDDRKHSGDGYLRLIKLIKTIV